MCARQLSLLLPLFVNACVSEPVKIHGNTRADRTNASKKRDDGKPGRINVDDQLGDWDVVDRVLDHNDPVSHQGSDENPSLWPPCKQNYTGRPPIPPPESIFYGASLHSQEQSTNDVQHFHNVNAKPKRLHDLFFSKPLLDIAISIPTASWEMLRNEKKVVGLDADCKQQSSKTTYQWYHGKISINGKNITDIGLRKKGSSGSRSTLKPSLKIRLDKYRDNTTYLGITRFALNNSRQDPTYMRSCLSYQIFREAGIPAPRCTLAQVSINGVNKGVYVVTEEIKQPFLARHFKNASGTLYEGEAADFHPDYFGQFEQETNKKVDQSRPHLKALINVVANAKKKDFIKKLSSVVNLDQFYRYWAIEGLIWHQDGYSGNINNYFLYADPSDTHRFHFLPWGIDASMMPAMHRGNLRSILTTGKIPKRLVSIEDGRKTYYDTLDELIDTVWNANRLQSKIDSYKKTLLTVIRDQESFLPAVKTLRSWIRNRKANLSKFRERDEHDWNQKTQRIAEQEMDRRAPYCRRAVGSIQGTFSTKWNTVNADEFKSGDASINIEFPATKAMDIDSTIEKSGVRPHIDHDGRHSLSMVVNLSNSKQYRLYAAFPDENFFDSCWVVGDHAIDLQTLRVTLIELDISTSKPVTLRTFELGSGTFSFDILGKSPGGVISGHFNAILLSTER